MSTVPVFHVNFPGLLCEVEIGDTLVVEGMLADYLCNFVFLKFLYVPAAHGILYLLMWSSSMSVQVGNQLIYQ